MARKLKTFVWVGDVRYGPDKPVPNDVATKITNPDVWAEDDDDTENVPPRVPSSRGTSPVPEQPPVTTDLHDGQGDNASDETSDDSGTSETDDGGTVERPAGNASRELWATYASGRGVNVTGQMGRDDIKAAVDEFEAQQAAQQPAGQQQSE